MMKRNSISYNMNNKGSAIITALVVSTVLLVLCLSLLLVASSLFSATVSKEADFPDREYIYSVAEEVEKELLNLSCTYKDDSEMEAFFTQDSHQLWDYIRVNLWQGFIKNGDLYTQYISEEDRVSGKIWPYYDKDASSDNIHGDAQYYSRYFTLDTGVSSGNKVVVQFYWELPENWDGDINNKKDTILHAVYRMYDDNDEVVSKVEKIYKLDCGTIDPLKDYVVNYYAVKSLDETGLSAKVLIGRKYYKADETIVLPTVLPASLEDYSGYKLGDTWYYANEEGVSSANIFDSNQSISSDLELYNICDINSFTVTFLYNNPDNNGTYLTETINYGSKVTEPAVPQVDGYRFKGWFKDSNCTESWDFNDTISENKYIYAKWTRIFTVTFDLRNGLETTYTITAPTGFTNESLVIEVEDGQTVAEPTPIPTAQETTKNKTVSFIGWMINSADSDLWNFSTPITENKILYAKWTKDYVARFVKNNFAVPENEILFTRSVQGKDHKLPEPNPAKEEDVRDALTNDYFDFLGWYQESSCQNQFVFNKNHNKHEVDVYAKWQRKAYKVTLKLGGHGTWNTVPDNLVTDADGSLYGPVAVNGTITAPTINKPNGYRFKGWNYTVTKTDKDSNVTNIVSTTDYWSFSTALNYSAYDHDNNIIEIELTADWEPEYTFEFYDYDSTDLDINYELIKSKGPYIQEEIQGLTDSDVNRIIKSGYRFIGWCTSTSSADIIESLSTVAGSSHADNDHVIALYAIYEKEYTVKFIDEENDSDDHIIKTIDSKTEAEINKMISDKDFLPTSTSIAEIPGYELEGYSYSLTGSSVFNTISAIDTTFEDNGIILIYIRRKPITYTITFLTYLDDEYNSKLTFTVENYPSKNTIKGIFDGVTHSYPGHYFVDFVYTNNGSLSYDSEQKAVIDISKADDSHNICLKEKWDLSTYTVSYLNAQYDVESNSIRIVNYDDVTNPLSNYRSYTVEYSNPITLSAASREGSNFLGWYIKSGNTWNKLPENDGSYSLAYNSLNPSSIEVYAIWSTIMYPVKFSTFGVDTNFENSISRDYAINQKVYKPDESDLASLKDGFEIVGWFKDDALTEEWNFETDTVTGPVTIYAKMNVSVTFNAGEGHFEENSVDIGNINTIKVQYNTPISRMPDDPVRDEYVFSHWKPNYNNENITDAIEFTAEWNEINKYTVNFANGNYIGKPDPEVNSIFLPDPISNISKTDKINEDQAKPKVDGSIGSFSWYMDSRCLGKKYDFSLSLIENFGNNLPEDNKVVTLYAKWDNYFIPRRVRFLVNGNAVLEKVYSNGYSLSSKDFKINTEAYYDQYGAFDGWYYNKNKYFSSNTSKYTVDKDTDFTAEFKGFKITYFLNIPAGGTYLGATYTYSCNDGIDRNNIYVESGNAIGNEKLKAPTIKLSFSGLTTLLAWIVNAFTDNVREPYFVGWYRDSELTIRAYPTDIITENTSLYAKWLTQKDIVSISEIEQLENVELDAAENWEFENWYAQNTTLAILNYIFGSEDYNKMQARKFWKKYIKGDGSDTNSSAANMDKSFFVMSAESFTSNEIIVNTASAPAEEESSEYEGPNTENIGNNTEAFGIDNQPEPTYLVTNEYICMNLTVNPFNHTINPRELWTWKKVS